jgi:hypothetical protein
MGRHQRQGKKTKSDRPTARRDWNTIAARATIVGVVLAPIIGYLTLAIVRNWWPFQVGCPVIVNSVPNKVDRASTGADADGNGQAYVFWQPFRCTGSNSPIIRYQIDAWLFINGYPQGIIHTQAVPSTSRSIVFTGLTNGDSYDFGIIAINSIGQSAPTFTNIVVPPRTTSA